MSKVLTPGELAPNFELKDVQGNRVRLSDFHGKPVPALIFKQYWKKERIPFTGLPDPNHSVARIHGQEVNLFKLGRRPLNCVIDAKGYVRFAHYGKSMSDIPTNAELLQVIDELNAASH